MFADEVKYFLWSMHKKRRRLNIFDTRVIFDNFCALI